jgi:hypothetical protein
MSGTQTLLTILWHAKLTFLKPRVLWTFSLIKQTVYDGNHKWNQQEDRRQGMVINSLNEVQQTSEWINIVLVFIHHYFFVICYLLGIELNFWYIICWQCFIKKHSQLLERFRDLVGCDCGTISALTQHRWRTRRTIRIVLKSPTRRLNKQRADCCVRDKCTEARTGSPSPCTARGWKDRCFKVARGYIVWMRRPLAPFEPAWTMDKSQYKKIEQHTCLPWGNVRYFCRPYKSVANCQTWSNWDIPSCVMPETNGSWDAPSLSDLTQLEVENFPVISELTRIKSENFPIV